MPASVIFLIPTHIAAILLGEYLFCGVKIKKLSFVDWLKVALHPIKPGYFLWAYLSEILIDGLFLYLAIVLQWNPLNFALLLLICKFLSSPFQVYFSYAYLSKNAAFALAVAFPMMLFFIAKSVPDLFLYAVILKGLLGNGISVARSQFAEEITSQEQFWENSN